MKLIENLNPKNNYIRIVAGIILLYATLCLFEVAMQWYQALTFSNPLLPDYLKKWLCIQSAILSAIIITGFLLALFAFLKRNWIFLFISIAVFVANYFCSGYLIERLQHYIFKF